MTTIAPALPATSEIAAEVHKSLQAIGVDPDLLAGPRETRTPITGEVILSTRAVALLISSMGRFSARTLYSIWRKAPGAFASHSAAGSASR